MSWRKHLLFSKVRSHQWVGDAKRFHPSQGGYIRTGHPGLDSGGLK